MEHHTPPATNMLVMGPWTHGGFARGEGDKVGNVSFGSNTSAYFREHIEFPFFLYQLKGKGDGKFPRAWVFQTGVNQWRKFDSWPPKDAQPETIYLDAKGKLSLTQPAAPSIDEYVSDPNKPAPYIGHVLQGMRFDYMTEDQRFASTRTDVLVYKSEVLDHDVTVTGPIGVDLKVATSGTDSDFVVKLIDVYPNDYPETEPPPANPRLQPANAIHMGGYEQLVRGEPFRGKYRKSFEKPVPFEPNKPDRITYNMPDVCHTFRTGHRIMVQVQSSWFPLTDRNPQKFMDIPNAHPEDFVKATERLYLGGPEGSKITLPVSIR
jgi:putative CocE/NonD family hydrolase